MSSLHRTGLVLLALLALGDVALPFTTDGEHPPMWVAIVGLVLGVASLVCLPAAWRGRTPALFGLLGTRVVSALLSLPAFFVDDVPGEVLGIVVLTVALTVVGAVLALAGSRQAVTS